MKIKAIIAALLLVLVLTSLLVACAQPAPAPTPTPTPAPTPAPAVQKLHIKIGTQEVEGDYGPTLGHAFDKLIGEMSNGNITTDVYPVGVVGDCAETIELTQSGELQICASAAGWQSGFVPEVNVFMLDYVLPGNHDALPDVLNNGDTAKKMADIFLGYHFMYLGGSDIGNDIRSSNKPLYTLADFKDFKMRTMASPIIVADYKAYGANPTPLPFGEVYTGLQTGLVEGQENPVSVAETMRFIEVQSHWTNAFYRHFLYTHIANVEWWNSLTDENKRMIKTAWWNADVYAMNYMSGHNEETLRRLPYLRKDFVYYELTPEEIAPFQEAAKTAYTVFLDPAIGGPKAQEILNTMLADRDAAAKKYAQ